MVKTGSDEDKAAAAPRPVPRFDRRKVRRSKTNDTHLVYKTRVSKVLDYMVPDRPVDKRSVQAVRSATGVSYVFIMALVKEGFLELDGALTRDMPVSAGKPSRRYVAVTDTGRRIHGLLADIDSAMGA